MALAPGDLLYTGPDAKLELQIGAGSFVRAGAETEVGLANQEPDFMQLKVTGGQVSLDARDLERARTLEIDTPNAALTIEQSGYYRVDVGSERTTLIVRRGGRAVVTPAGGETSELSSNEEAVIEGTDAPRVATYPAPEFDDWDRWSYARTDQLVGARSAQYVPRGVYGTSELDQYGQWRTVPRYGRVWVPEDVAPTWAPYSTGQWVWDAEYGSTWVDDAPWGWAPYHYGRWIYADSYWAWAPGPVVVEPVYAPALVAFFGGPGFHVSIGVPFVSWVALGWGEPCIPWWGGAGFVGVPWWGGWGGPRVVNNVEVNRTTIVNVNNINVFENTRVRNAIVGVPGDRFGRGDIQRARLADLDARHLTPVRGALPVDVGPRSLTALGHGRRPPETLHGRSVVATRAPRDPQSLAGGRAERRVPGAGAAGAVRLVPSARPQANGVERRLPPGRAMQQERALPPRFDRASRRPGTLADVRRPFAADGAQRVAPPPHPEARSTQRRLPREQSNDMRQRQASIPPRFDHARRPDLSASRRPSAPDRAPQLAPPPPPRSNRTEHQVPPARRDMPAGRSSLPPRFQGAPQPAARPHDGSANGPARSRFTAPQHPAPRALEQQRSLGSVDVPTRRGLAPQPRFEQPRRPAPRAEMRSAPQPRPEIRPARQPPPARVEAPRQQPRIVERAPSSVPMERSRPAQPPRFEGGRGAVPNAPAARERSTGATSEGRARHPQSR